MIQTMFYGLQVSLCFHCSKGNGKGRRRNAQWDIQSSQGLS